MRSLCDICQPIILIYTYILENDKWIYKLLTRIDSILNLLSINDMKWFYYTELKIKTNVIKRFICLVCIRLLFSLYYSSGISCLSLVLRISMKRLHHLQ